MTNANRRPERFQPARDYAEAMEQLTALRSQDGPDVNPDCHSRLLTHGRKTERVLVLIHGMTNCPCQFSQLAPLFFERGYNVLLPRQPRDGLKDLNTRALGDLTLAELKTFAHQSIDVARGLGERVTVAGISAGGTLAAWIGQIRSDVDAVAPIAPLFGILPPLPIFNTTANFAVMHALQWAPNIMTQSFQPFKDGPPQGYLGFASRGLATVMRLGQEVYRAAAMKPPRARSLLMMLNPVDPAVNNRVTRAVLDRWRKQGANAREYTFDGARSLIHDIIDPDQRLQQCDYVYPILLDQIAAL